MGNLVTLSADHCEICQHMSILYKLKNTGEFVLGLPIKSAFFFVMFTQQKYKIITCIIIIPYHANPHNNPTRRKRGGDKESSLY